MGHATSGRRALRLAAASAGQRFERAGTVVDGPAAVDVVGAVLLHRLAIGRVARAAAATPSGDARLVAVEALPTSGRSFQRFGAGYPRRREVPCVSIGGWLRFSRPSYA